MSYKCINNKYMYGNYVMDCVSNVDILYIVYYVSRYKYV